MEGAGRSMRGRKPRCLILSPTRELAMQTANEATALAPSLSTLPVYGGTAYDPQLDGLRAGTDIVVGTPGR
jgi:ATP-dependent RNA helicase DeaD